MRRIRSAHVPAEGDDFVPAKSGVCPECGAMAGVEVLREWIECPYCGRMSNPQWDGLTADERAALDDRTAAGDEWTDAEAEAEVEYLAAREACPNCHICGTDSFDEGKD